MTQTRERHILRMAGHALVRVLAVVAMIFQVLFTADHLGASAVRALGAAPADSGFGIMEICTGEGVQIIDLGDGSGGTGHDCPVCISAAVSDFGQAADAACPDLPLVTLALSRDIPQQQTATPTRQTRTRLIRAPPVFLI